ncbi:UDP-N-acetylmuramoyl-tripeptide--D-alanyl-D-alanine ligase [Peptostreptococcus faecalis]|uniref:UDP-N-acetylmuramoyl-tripeptide--D-alanyl-D- alanine ligase n=1 Tax=Peptostreptococcus faecalis TaxID=2045015 RepID=UPI000C79FD4D|nr:UDP-N-acetylmuramoyl-tripeptide--D-alanyl-D-alanine ligase [Peptostreptococcus faecalis]
MNSLKIEEIIKSTAGKLMYGNVDNEIDKIVIDSRDADSSSLFISIIGENQDGHKFIKSAYDQGCRNFMISDASYISKEIYDSNVVIVDNTEIAMGKIAKYYIQRFDIPVVAVTGSVGKTTTRDMVYSVVSNRFNTLKNEKNLNNQFGVPLTVFNLDERYKCAIIEMGMTGLGEIQYLADIVRPKIGVISNIGMSHIERLGNQENIFKAKMEITTFFDENSTLIVNGDDDFLGKLVDNKDKSFVQKKYNIMSFGFSEKNTLYCSEFETYENKSTKFIVTTNEGDFQFEIPTVGVHNIYNAMSAILVGLSLEMDIDEIRAGLLNFIPTENRQDIIQTKNMTIINDVYNASPDSMIASLKVLSLYKNRRKVAILGDCLEMGEFAEGSHRRIGKEAAKKSDVILTSGEASKYIGLEAIENGFDSENVYHFDKKEDLIKNIQQIIKNDDVILAKASRGMKFEDIVEYLEEVSQC